MERMLWEVACARSPGLCRHCRRCGAKTEHASTGKFRVNAQKKTLEVWLVAQCAACGATWNLEIASGVRPEALGRERLEQYLQNDPALALQYAMDPVWLKRRGAEIKLPPFTVEGPVPVPGQAAQVAIASRYPAKLRVARVVQRKLGWSGSAYERAVARGLLAFPDGTDPLRGHLQGTVRLMIKNAQGLAAGIQAGGV